MNHSTSSPNSDLSDLELRSTTLGHPAYESSSSSSGGGTAVLPLFATITSSAPASAASVHRKKEEEEDKKEEEGSGDTENAWMEYACPSPELFGGANFHCVWQDTLHDGTSRSCGYHSKKNLVKRHIESKHLQLRCASAPLVILHSSPSTGTDGYAVQSTGHSSARFVGKISPKKLISTLTSIPSESIGLFGVGFIRIF